MTPLLQTVVSNLVSVAILVFATWVGASLYARFRARGLLEAIAAPRGPGFPDWIARGIADGTLTGGPGAPASADSPRTFSGVDHEARYAAPEVVAEALERERDARWVRLKRVLDKTDDGRPMPYDGYGDLVAKAYGRSIEASSLDVLRAMDMRALGIPCIRCGRAADDHPEFPLCARTTDKDGRPLPSEPPVATAQAVAQTAGTTEAPRALHVGQGALTNFTVSNGTGELHVHFHEKTGQPESSPYHPGPGPTVTLQWRGNDYIEIPLDLYRRLVLHGAGA